MRRTLVVGGIVVSALSVGCGDEGGNKPFTMTGVNSGPPAENRGTPTIVVPRRDGGPVDAAAGDSAVSDSAVDAAPAVADAARVDAAPPAPDAASPLVCTGARDCAVAVDLSSCSACPVPAQLARVASTRCLVPHQPGLALAQYQPQDCFVQCRQPATIRCDEPPALPTCAGGECALLR